MKKKPKNCFKRGEQLKKLYFSAVLIVLVIVSLSFFVEATTEDKINVVLEPRKSNYFVGDEVVIDVYLEPKTGVSNIMVNNFALYFLSKKNIGGNWVIDNQAEAFTFQSSTDSNYKQDSLFSQPLTNYYAPSDYQVGTDKAYGWLMSDFKDGGAALSARTKIGTLSGRALAAGNLKIEEETAKSEITYGIGPLKTYYVVDINLDLTIQAHVCGDGFCTGTETLSICAQDCGCSSDANCLDQTKSYYDPAKPFCVTNLCYAGNPQDPCLDASDCKSGNICYQSFCGADTDNNGIPDDKQGQGCVNPAFHGVYAALEFASGIFSGYSLAYFLALGGDNYLGCLKGDLNKDGVINAQDFSDWVNNYQINKNSNGVLTKADLNQDGKVAAIDASDQVNQYKINKGG